MKKKIFYIACSIIILGLGFNAQAASSDDLAKQMQILDSSIDNLKSNIASCRAKLNELNSCSQESMQLRLKCRAQNYAYMGAIMTALSKVARLHDEKCKSKTSK